MNYRKLNCMSDCLTDVNCESVGYHSDQKRCRLYRVLISGSGGVTENGWEYFSIREDFCPTENFTHNRIADVCYAISPERKPCGEAATICSSLSARLLVVDSQMKQDWARDLCVRQNIEGVHFDVYFEREGSALKLGSSGMDLTYTNWAIGQPDYGQPCIGMEAWHEWRWHDYVRSLEAGIICEIRRP
ncbi:collectin-12-like isoform X2 [Mizuhopecten yessoensis]|uniref:collectin-12-like isoform X2 n=1 Tax=Mizuhopecten yessoensis TaxID=6573 RepID=UPI000B45B81C|nr:collectin-12-like isoform X2 [Mizuhopecten yessoensis]